MCDPRMINAVKDRMLSHRGFLTGRAASLTGITRVAGAPKTGTDGAAHVRAMV